MASKVFIITGASKGIGAAIAHHLLSQSHKVVITARSSEPLEDLKKSHPDQVQFIAGDIVDPQVRVPVDSMSCVPRLMHVIAAYKAGRPCSVFLRQG